MNARESKAAVAKKVPNVLHFCTSILNFGFTCSKIRQRLGEVDYWQEFCVYEHTSKKVYKIQDFMLSDFLNVSDQSKGL